MQTVTRLDVLRNAVATLRRDGGTIALVPTMGALHAGHLALVHAARDRADHVIASIFVNPRQFGPREDFGAYPRQLARDAAMLEAEGVAVLWAPDRGEVYPDGYATNVGVAGVSEGLCGADRPGHFDGVATVVLKLFNQVRPDMAFFGEKDWQQLAVIRRMARDLDLSQPAPRAIHGVAIVREADGLAMSSRNAYLSAEQRAAAAALPAAMRDAIAALQAGEPVPQALGHLRDRLHAAGFESVDYAELRDGDSLGPIDRLDDGSGDRSGNGSGDISAAAARLFVAARIGGTRLIDNIALTGERE